jgi:hypothetical protein
MLEVPASAGLWRQWWIVSIMGLLGKSRRFVVEVRRQDLPAGFWFS